MPELEGLSVELEGIVSALKSALSAERSGRDFQQKLAQLSEANVDTTALRCINCGFKDATVLRFTRERYNRRVYATKGRAGESPIWRESPTGRTRLRSS